MGVGHYNTVMLGFLTQLGGSRCARTCAGGRVKLIQSGGPSSLGPVLELDPAVWLIFLQFRGCDAGSKVLVVLSRTLYSIRWLPNSGLKEGKTVECGSRLTFDNDVNSTTRPTLSPFYFILSSYHHTILALYEQAHITRESLYKMALGLTTPVSYLSGEMSPNRNWLMPIRPGLIRNEQRGSKR